MASRVARIPITLFLALSLALVGLTGVANAESASSARADLYGMDFTMQNYLAVGEDLIPFFEEQSVQINRGVEIRQSDGYIYSFNFTRSTIIMRWNLSPDFDFFEPYVGKAGGFSREEAAAAGLADQYHITFEEPISHFDIAAGSGLPLTPDVHIVDDYTLVISVPGGTTIGDGVNAVITFG